MTTLLIASDDRSLRNTCVINISNLDGSKMAADIVRCQDEVSSAASSRKTLRLTWQYERHAVCSSARSRHRSVIVTVAILLAMPTKCRGNRTEQDQRAYCLPDHCITRWHMCTPMLFCHQESLHAWRFDDDSRARQLSTIVTNTNRSGRTDVGVYAWILHCRAIQASLGLP